MTSVAAAKVFIVDDDADMRAAIEGLLKSAGLRILVPITITTTRSRAQARLRQI
jgi:FixJ family two-component response regulator